MDIFVGDACAKSGEVASRFANLVYEVEDVIKNYARHKVAVNQSQTSMMKNMQKVKDKIDILGKKHHNL